MALPLLSVMVRLPQGPLGSSSRCLTIRSSGHRVITTTGNQARRQRTRNGAGVRLTRYCALRIPQPSDGVGGPRLERFVTTSGKDDLGRRLCFLDGVMVPAAGSVLQDRR
jgi:hypothetical protein